MERTMGITEENQEELNGFQLYLDELEGITSCSEAENTELAKEAANGSAEAKKRLIEGNLKNGKTRTIHAARPHDAAWLPDRAADSQR